MMITMVSNFLNHHQLMLCNAIRKNCDEFYFLATQHIPKDRLSLGYRDMDYTHDFVLRTYDGSTDKMRIAELLTYSDAVIFGECSNSLIEYRMRQNKLSFLASERFFKKGAWRRFYPPLSRKIIERTSLYSDKDYYILCASAFLPWDVSLLGFPEEKCYKWGYFPQNEVYEKYPERNNKTLRLLWVGRMLDWKRADYALKAAAYLNKEGIDFVLDMIGEGQCLEKLKRLSTKLGISNKVNFMGSMSPESVRENMLKADIFLFTSNFREGWGAVLNESMSCGCAVIASSSIGSVPYLLEDGKNGIIYKYDSQSDLNKKLKELALSSEKRRTLGENAIHTINEEYSAEVAGERFVSFIKNKEVFERGPMSKAEIIKNKWYK